MRLTMSPENTELVLQGRKTTTIRPLSYLGRFSIAERVRLGRTDREVRIDEISELELSKVSEGILHSEGNFRSREGLLLALKHFYPKLTEESHVLLIRFTLLQGK
jgi:hypothetical protein